MIVLETIAVETARILNGYVCMSGENRRRYLEDIRNIYETNIASIMQDAGYVYHHTSIHPGEFAS